MKTGIYRHFKGKEYKLIYIAKHSETLENMVVYQALYGTCDIWVRPLTMWNESVEHGGQKVKRFEYVGDERKLCGKNPIEGIQKFGRDR